MKKHTSKSSSKSGASASQKLIPLGDRVLIKEFSPEEGGRTTESGIIIPDTAEKDRDSKKGKIVAVGAGRYEGGMLVPMSVSIGDIVLFQWGEKVKIESEEYYLVREGEISAIVK